MFRLLLTNRLSSGLTPSTSFVSSPCFRLIQSPCRTIANSASVSGKTPQRFRWIERLTQRWKSTNSRTRIPAPAPKAAISDIRRLLALAGPEKYRLAGGVFLLAISSGVTVSVPFFIGRIIDMIFKSESVADSENDKLRREKIASALDKLTQFCYTLVGVFVVGAIANFGRVYLMQSAGALVINRLRSRVFSSILRQEVAFFDKTKTGELVNRLSNDASLVGYATTMNISDGLRSVVSGIGGAGMMWYTSPSLSIIGFAIVPPVALIAMVYGRFLRNLTKRVNDALADATQVAEERIGSIRTVRAFGAEELEGKRYSNKVDAIMGLAYKDAFAKAGFFGSNANQIAVLQDGKVAELGTYDSLVSIPDGVFRKLVEKQTEVRSNLTQTEPIVRAQI